MMILMMMASHILLATLVAVMVCIFLSGKTRELEVRLQQERAERAEIARCHDKTAAGGLAGTLPRAGDNDLASLRSNSLHIRSKVRDMGEVASGMFR